MLPEPTGSTLHLVLLSHVACLSVAVYSLYIRNLMTESPELYLGTSYETAFGYALRSVEIDYRVVEGALKRQY